MVCSKSNQRMRPTLCAVKRPCTGDVFQAGVGAGVGAKVKDDSLNAIRCKISSLKRLKEFEVNNGLVDRLIGC
jgi:hypothetical protein